MGVGKTLVTSSAARSARGMASSTVGTPNLTITESVSPYTTCVCNVWDREVSGVPIRQTFCVSS